MAHGTAAPADREMELDEIGLDDLPPHLLSVLTREEGLTVEEVTSAVQTAASNCLHSADSTTA